MDLAMMAAAVGMASGAVSVVVLDAFRRVRTLRRRRA